MNPAFILLIILGAIALWFVLAPVFRGIGSIISGLYRHAEYEMYENPLDDEEEDDVDE